MQLVKNIRKKVKDEERRETRQERVEKRESMTSEGKSTKIRMKNKRKQESNGEV